MVALYIALGYGVAAIVGHFLMTSFFPTIAIGDKPSIIEMVFAMLIAFLLSLRGGVTAYRTQKWVAILSPCLLIVIVGPIPLFFIAHVPLFYSVAWPTIIGLFVEDLPVGQGALELVHRRYLEYWRSFV